MIKRKSLVFTYKANQALAFWLIYTLIRNAMGCNNRNDLLYLSFTLKILIFLEAYIYNPVKHLGWSFYCEKPLSIFTKRLHHRCSLEF